MYTGHMTKTLNIITLNALLCVAFIMGMGSVYNHTMEHRAGVLASDEQARQAQAQVNTENGRVAFKEMTKGMHCVGADKPFLTDHIVVSDGMPNMEWVTFKEALRIHTDRGSEWTVVAYCN